MKNLKFDEVNNEGVFIFNNRGFRKVEAQVAQENNENYNAVDLKSKDLWFFAGDEQVSILEKN